MHAAATFVARHAPTARHVKDDRWVKAHVADELAKLADQPQAVQQAFIDNLTPSQTLDAIGNSEADLAAKQALEDAYNSKTDQWVFDAQAATYAKTFRFARGGLAASHRAHLWVRLQAKPAAKVKAHARHVIDHPLSGGLKV